MASALPFNEMLDVVYLPWNLEVIGSFFGRGTCTFTVVNYRDKKQHEVEVQVTKLSDFRRPSPYWNEYRVEGAILKIDGKRWGPPANEFDSRYIEDHPHHSGLKIISHV